MFPPCFTVSSVYHFASPLKWTGKSVLVYLRLCVGTEKMFEEPLFEKMIQRLFENVKNKFSIHLESAFPGNL